MARAVYTRDVASPPVLREDPADSRETAGKRRPKTLGRRILGIGFVFALGSLPAACTTEPDKASSPRRPHVLLVTVDTLRADYLSANGYPQPTSPFVDELLRSGYHFSAALTPIPRTTQALASLLTGLYPHSHGLRTLFGRLRREVPVLAEELRAAGYRTVAVVSNHLLTRRRGLDRGFEVYDFADDSRDARATTDAAIAHLRQRSPDERVFLWVHYIDPHVPYYPPRELAERFDPDYRGRYRLHFGDVKGGIGDRAYPRDLPKAKAVFQNDLPEAVNAHIRRLYAAEIRYTDEQIERLVRWLEKRFGNDWLVVFTADHGESLGEHDYYYDHGDYVYQATLRVPLAFVFPPRDPLRGSRTIESWVSLVDVKPTLEELLGLRSRGRTEGRSLVAWFLGRSLPERAVFAECGKSFFPHLVRRRVRFDTSGRFRAVVLGRWKLIWTPGLEEHLAYELYDLRNDPHEEKNVYRADHPAVPELASHLFRWLSNDGDAPEPPLTEADRERLRALGYLE